MIAVFDRPPISIDDFLAWYPETPGQRYELRRGTIIEMPKPKGKHSEIAGFIAKVLNQAIDRSQRPAFIPKECILKISEDTGYEPDVTVVSRPSLSDEPRWESASVLERGESALLAVEVVSTNWRDDYALKMVDYEGMGVGEYWIVDYLGLGGRRYIGNPKQPTLTVCSLVDGEYELQQFRGCDPIFSPTFPDLGLTVHQVFNPGQ
ncbi:Uma2 family endonuclease [Nodosilinea sp. P-1105]|uniref:Uma2 family endonuclease n=1 Tax=Nodosilinea sp. P-1105 TaxID=2546229 RepID=UPI00146E68DE|nr:Uma2 family endonuclease [Nodosilinea sp. P-1105]NMF84877.1 Uma2 family endonuclease [Nodosilinea sp. P-1105]